MDAQKVQKRAWSKMNGGAVMGRKGGGDRMKDPIQSPRPWSLLCNGRGREDGREMNMEIEGKSGGDVDLNCHYL